MAHGTAIAVEARPQAGAVFVASDGAAVLVMSMVYGCTLATVCRRDYARYGINFLKTSHRRAKQVHFGHADPRKRIGQWIAVIGLVVCRTSCKTPAANLVAGKRCSIRSHNCTAIGCGGSSRAVGRTGGFIGRSGCSVYSGIGCCIVGSIIHSYYYRLLCAYCPEGEKRGKEKILKEKVVGKPHRYPPLERIYALGS